MPLEMLISLLALVLMEIVLGIDNIVFIAVVAGKLPKALESKARTIGLSIALLMRVLLLFGITYVMGFTKPIFTLFDHAFSGRDLILLAGGMFLVGKATHEIFEKVEAPGSDGPKAISHASLKMAILQIVVLDLVFSLDSVITAVGMVKELWMMITAVVIAMVIMLAFSGTVSRFINKHPSLVILALSFLVLIGVMLVAEGMGQHINRGYIYFAMFFSLSVEFVNMRMRLRRGGRVAHGGGG